MDWMCRFSAGLRHPGVRQPDRESETIPRHGENRACMRRVVDAGPALRPVEPFTHFLARFEERRALFRHRHFVARAWVAPRARLPLSSRERPKPAQLHAIAARHCVGDLAQDRVYDNLDVALIKMGITRGEPLNQFGFYQDAPPIAARSLWRPSSIQATLSSCGPFVNRRVRAQAARTTCARPRNYDPAKWRLRSTMRTIMARRGSKGTSWNPQRA